MSQAHLTIFAEKRIEKKKSGAKKLRKDGKIPSVLYWNEGGKVLSIPLSIKYKEFTMAINDKKLNSRLVSLVISENEKEIETTYAIIRDIQMHPVNDTPISIDFQKIGKKEKFKVGVRVKTINEDMSPGLKKGGIVNITKHHFHFESDVDSFMSHLIVDVTDKEIGDTIHINEIKLKHGFIPLDKSNFHVLSISGKS